jgi:hypothetical protein
MKLKGRCIQEAHFKIYVDVVAAWVDDSFVFRSTFNNRLQKDRKVKRL